MTFRCGGRLRGRAAGRERSISRWVVVAVGLAVLATALVYAASPYQQTREFRRVVDCDQGLTDCFASEPGWIRDRGTYTTTTTDTDANGLTHTTTTTHYTVTWERANGARQTRDVSSSFYRKAEEGQPAKLRIWRSDVVGVEVTGGSQWFLPKSGRALGRWLYVAWLGLGVLLWGLFLGWWDGFFLLAFRTFSWMFMSILPVDMAAHTLAYGWTTGAESIVEIVFGFLFVGASAAMLIASLEQW